MENVTTDAPDFAIPVTWSGFLKHHVSYKFNILFISTEWSTQVQDFGRMETACEIRVYANSPVSEV